MRHSMIYMRSTLVAPHAGAWIETGLSISGIGYPASRPTRARGLKLILPVPEVSAVASRPTRARGLKLA